MKPEFSTLLGCQLIEIKGFSPCLNIKIINKKIRARAQEEPPSFSQKNAPEQKSDFAVFNEPLRQAAAAASSLPKIRCQLCFVLLKKEFLNIIFLDRTFSFQSASIFAVSMPPYLTSDKGSRKTKKRLTFLFEAAIAGNSILIDV